MAGGHLRLAWIRRDGGRAPTMQSESRDFKACLKPLWNTLFFCFVCFFLLRKQTDLCEIHI
jgi:hypothetical protein